MKEETLKYLIALQSVSLVGPKLAKNLIAYCGSPEAVFKEKKPHLRKIPGIGRKTSENIVCFKNFSKAEKEVEFILIHKIKPLFYLEDEYPQRLRDLDDAPVLLYFKGETDLNRPKVLAFVGTRDATSYGKKTCQRFIEELMKYNVTVISGLAFGIDYMAHKTAFETGLPTVAVLGHGLDTLYPSQHRSLAVKMLENGGLLTEYPSGTIPEKENFPSRNRIVAGMVDGVVVVESGKKGGAMITAEIAFSYNREIFAVPGRAIDEMSAGCNNLIRYNKAYLAENVNDIAYHLGWDIKIEHKTKNTINFAALSGIEKKIIEVIQKEEKINIDKMLFMINIDPPQLSMMLLEMEFNGFIKTLPGNFYQMA